MSILLDALRKSEKDQKKSEAPSIHSGEQSKSTPGFSRKGWLLSLIVLVFVVSSLAWYQFRQPEEASEPTARLASGAMGSAEKPSSEPTGKTDNGKRLAVVDSNVVASHIDKKPRTPVETYRKAAGTDAQLRPSVNGKTKSAESTAQVRLASNASNKKTNAKKQATKDQVDNKNAANKQASAKPVNKNAANKQASARLVDKNAANKQASVRPASNKRASNKQADSQKANSKPAAKKSTTAKPAETSQKPFRPQQPALISYWELPDAIRAKVPEMKFTVLVYAKDPADRFVLINGQRYGQGDEVQQDLVVREIRRKGVVFKYRLYKFLVER